MKYTFLVFVILLLPNLLLGQKLPEEESYTVPLSIDFERFLVDSILSYEEKLSTFEPSNVDLESLEGEFGFKTQFYIQDSKYKDYELLTKTLSVVNDYFNFKQILDIDLSFNFCLDEVVMLNETIKPIEEKIEGQEFSYQRDWFSNLKNYLFDTKIIEAKQLVIPIVVLDVDAVGFASMEGHDGVTDIIVLSSKLFSDEVSGRNVATTLSHLIANYLGVKPLWYNEQGMGDLVNDTPCHDSPNFGKGTDEVHLSLCSPMEIELSYNLMDNLNDNIRFGLTKGQVKRMISSLTLNEHRKGLLSSPCLDSFKDKSTMLGLQLESLNVNIEPNPANSFLSLRVSNHTAEAGDYRIINSSGAKVLSGAILDQVTRIDVSSLPNGIYYIMTELNGSGEVFKNRLVIAK